MTQPATAQVSGQYAQTGNVITTSTELKTRFKTLDENYNICADTRALCKQEAVNSWLNSFGTPETSM